MTFPTSSPRDAVPLEEAFGSVHLVTATTVTPAAAIDPRFPWMMLSWDKNSPGPSPASVSGWTFCHRNLITEVNEFFRRRQDTIVDEGGQPFRWAYGTIIDVVRDAFAVAAKFKVNPDGTFSQEAVQNFLPRAKVTTPALATYAESGPWPQVTVAVPGSTPHYLEAHRAEGVLPSARRNGWPMRRDSSRFPARIPKSPLNRGTAKTNFSR